MGTFNVQISIGDQQRAHWIDLDALVDTGASITLSSGVRSAPTGG